MSTRGAEPWRRIVPPALDHPARRARTGTGGRTAQAECTRHCSGYAHVQVRPDANGCACRCARGTVWNCASPTNGAGEE